METDMNELGHTIAIVAFGFLCLIVGLGNGMPNLVVFSLVPIFGAPAWLAVKAISLLTKDD